MAKITAGKVPGGVVTLEFDGEIPSMEEVMNLAANELGRMNGMAGPAFTFTKDKYRQNGKDMFDVPFLNAIAQGKMVNGVFTSTDWTGQLKDGDELLLIPKIAGAQIIVDVGMSPGATGPYGIYGPNEKDLDSDAGTVKHALATAGISMNGDQIVEVNNQRADLSTTLASGDKVIVKQKPNGHAPAKGDEIICHNCGKPAFRAI